MHNAPIVYVNEESEKQIQVSKSIIFKSRKVNKSHTFMITGTTLGKLIGNSNPLRASSANAKHPPCHEPSPCDK